MQGEDIFLCKSVKYFGIVYWRDTYVVYAVDNFNIEFYRIENCAIIHGVPYLVESSKQLDLRGIFMVSGYQSQINTMF